MNPDGIFLSNGPGDPDPCDYAISSIKVMLEKKNIHPNVDFPCGPTYYMMGIDIDFYTPIFVMSRITGWSAHIMEQHASNKLIRPLSKYKGEEVREVMLLNQR